MPTLAARTLITATTTIPHPVIDFNAAGEILSITSDPTVTSDRILAPTFLDIHIHGAAGEDVMHANPSGLAQIQNFLARKGTAHYLPTTVTAPLDETLRALEALANAIESETLPDQAKPIGIHLEGPFLSHAKRGVHPTELLQPPSIDLFTRFQQAARGHIRLLTLAPETDGALALIEHATSQGVRLSLGHTNATAAEARAAIAAGATSATHLFNAMRPLDHREPGVIGTVLDTESLFADLICDGVHVAPELVRLWLRLKGDHAILITDAISATGMPDGQYTLANLPVTVANGRCSLTAHPETLAGSVLTLDRAVANLQAFTGCSLDLATRCASAHPAAMLGLSESIASLHPGQPASFNQYTPEGRLEATYLHGRKIAT
jgi:N-acetylglucosamine-6-phosphate deacetylase